MDAPLTEVADEPKKELSPYELGVRDALAAGRGTVKPARNHCADERRR